MSRPTPFCCPLPVDLGTPPPLPTYLDPACRLVSPDTPHVHSSGVRIGRLAVAAPFCPRTFPPLPPRSLTFSILVLGLYLNAHVFHSLNRNSMPVTGRGRELPDLASVLRHLPKDLLGDEDDKHASQTPQNPVSSPTRNTFFQLNHSNDPFPVLLRSEASGGVQLGNMSASGSQLSENSAALDLAQSPSTETEAGSTSNAWSSFGRHQRAQQSLPMNSVRPMSQQMDDYSSTPIGSGAQTPTKTAAPNRHSMGATYNSYSDVKRPAPFSSASNQASTPTPPRVQSSLSTNDIPTIKNLNGPNASLASPLTGPKTHAEQHFQNHNANIGRVPLGAVNRHSREFSPGDTRVDEQNTVFRPVQSVLQASAAPFGPNVNSPAVESDDQQQATPGAATSLTFGSLQNQQQMYNGYGMPTMQGMNGMPMGVQTPWQNPLTVYQPPYGVYQQYGQYNQQRAPDSQARVIQARRNQNGEGLSCSEPAKRCRR